MQSLGAEVRDIRLPTLGEFGAVNRVILQSEAWAIHAPWLRERPQDYGKLARRRLLPGAFYGAGDYVQAQRRRLEMIAAVEAALREVDVLLCASAMDPPSRLDDPAETERTYPRQARTPFNVTGHPALAMMAGLSRGRAAALGAVRRPVFRRGEAVSGSARLGARGRHRRKTSAARLTAAHFSAERGTDVRRRPSRSVPGRRVQHRA